MKLLHLADLHIGKRVYEYSMAEEQKAMLSQALSMVEERDVDAVLIAGDVYDKSIPTVEGIKLFDGFLTELANKEVPVFIISGNHDSAERLAFGRSLMQNAKAYISGTYEDELLKVTLSDTFGEVNVYLLPFLKPQQIVVREGEEVPKDYTEAVRTVLKRLQVDTAKRNVLLAHQFVAGADIEPERAESETKAVGGVDMVDYHVFDDFDYVALGHLHGAQRIGRDTVRYAGSPVKYSFSEARQTKSATLVTLKEKGTVEIEKLPFTAIHDMREIKGTLEQLTSADVLAETDTEDYMHVTLTDDEEIYDVLGRVRATYPNLMLLDFDNERTRAEGADSLTAEQVKERETMDLFEEFFEKQTGLVLNERQKKIMQDIMEKNGENR